MVYFCRNHLEWRIMEEKLSTIYLVSSQTALQYLMSVSKKYRQIATEAIFECLRLGYPLNDMEITGKARELLRKRNAIGWSSEKISNLISITFRYCRTEDRAHRADTASVFKYKAKPLAELFCVKPESVIRAWVDFVWILMSNSGLLRIKNRQKTLYKKQKTASSI